MNSALGSTCYVTIALLGTPSTEPATLGSGNICSAAYSRSRKVQWPNRERCRRPCAGCLQTVTDPAGKALGYAYDADGNMTALSYPNGTQSQWTYDRDSRVTQIKAAAVVGGTMAAPFFSAAYTRDGLEQVTSESPQSYE